MITTESEQFARQAEALYQERLKQVLEPAHNDEFVAIEPESGEYFLGATISEAAALARRAHPNKLTHIMLVGHKAALHIGMSVQ
jgi:hypothetical protein